MHFTLQVTIDSFTNAYIYMRQSSTMFKSLMINCILLILLQHLIEAYLIFFF